MAEGWLCMISEGKIVGMDVGKLIQGKPEEEFVVDWGSLSSPPFDFSTDLPHMHMHPFVFDSKIHLAGGVVMWRPSHAPTKLQKLWVPSYQIYELDIIDNEEKEKEKEKEKKKKKKEPQPLLTVTESVPKAPVPFDSLESLVANISGDAYFLVYNRMVTGGERGIWVLRSGGLKQWERLPPPPSLPTFPSSGYCEYFVLPDKKIFLALKRGESIMLCSFSPRTGTWRQEDFDKFMESFCLWIDGKPHLCFRSTMVSVPGLNNNSCSVMLSWFRLEVVDECGDVEPLQSKMRIHALLVNEDGVCLHQPLEECFEGIQPICYSEVTPFLVDLGNNTVCALLCGSTKQRQIPLLWVSIFKLAMKDEHAFNTDTNTEAPPPVEQSFLSVRVLGRHVFTMKHNIREFWKDAFICPPPPLSSSPTKKDTGKRKKLLHRNMLACLKGWP